MTSDVVALPGFSVPLAHGEPHPELVEMLEGLLEQARAGRLVGLAYACVKRDPVATGTEWAEPGEYGLQLTGAVGMLHYRLMAAINDMHE